MDTTPEHRCELIPRKISATRRTRDTDHDQCPHHHQNWRTGEIRTRQTRALAAALGMPVDHVSVINDPQQAYAQYAQTY